MTSPLVFYLALETVYIMRNKTLIFLEVNEMKKYVFRKKFNYTTEIEKFMERCVGKNQYKLIDPKHVSIDKFNVTVALTHTKYFYDKKETLEKEGFTMTREEV